MHIAITGGTGFLGRYLVRNLACAHRLRCWYRTGSNRSGFEDIAGLPVEWLPGELNNDQSIGQLVKGVDALVHAAVEWEGPRNRGQASHGEQRPFFETNLIGSLKLFQAAFEAGVKRCVFISSCAVHDVILGDRPLDETHPLWPRSHYGAHKAALEAFVHSFGFGEGWPICALRPTGIYGLAYPPADSRWYDLVGEVMRGAPIASAKGGKEVHAADVARAVQVLLGADAGAITGQAYNCYDLYVAEQTVARLARELVGSRNDIADLNPGAKNQIAAGKLRALGMTFGGEAQLRSTILELIQAQRSAGPSSS